MAQNFFYRILMWRMESGLGGKKKQQQCEEMDVFVRNKS